MRCPSCGTQHDNTELVCQHCGTLLSLSPEELDRVERYRLGANTELLCVLFADISGFTGIANRSLPLSQKILAVHSTLVQAIVERDQAGEVVNTAGDGVLAVFSNPATATERALEMHAAGYHYHQGMLTDGYLADALRSTRLAPHPSTDDEEYRIHIGMHLGLVTRGGRTSRDVFGHNVNVAFRLCSLAGGGQCYMSEAVYDNARLILGGRDDLEWQVWKEQPIRGLDEPITVVAVAQQPYNTISPPRGSKHVRTPGQSSRRRTAMLVSLLILCVALLGLLAGNIVRQSKQEKRQVEVETPAGMRGGEEYTAATLPPLIATMEDEIPAGGEKPANADSSAVNTTLVPPDPEMPPSEGTPATGTDEASAQDLATLERLRAAESIQFSNSQQKIPAMLLASMSREALTLVVGFEQQTGPQAHLALLIDGDCDRKLHTQSSAPFTDAMLRTGSPTNGDAGFHYLTVQDGKAGAALQTTPNVIGRASFTSGWTMYTFRVKYVELGLSERKDANFRLEYWPDGVEKPPFCYPGPGGSLRQLVMPR